MLKILLSTTLGLATLSAAHAQYVYNDYVPPKPEVRVAASAADKPQYGGFYVSGKQLTDIDCYGFDSYDVVVPNFPNLSTADKLTITVGVFQYGANKKAVTPRADYCDYFEFTGAKLQALQEKFRGKGYMVVSKSDLVAAYNQSREMMPASDNQLISAAASASLNAAKYVKTDPAKTDQSVLVVQTVTGQISGYGVDNYGNSYPRYNTSVVYRAPAVVLHNRLYTKSLPLKGFMYKTLPEMTAENCTTNKGADIPLTKVKQVGEEGYGEEILVD